MDPIELELYCLAIATLTLISICTYRVVKFRKTETRNSTIFFLLIWVFALTTVLLGLAGVSAPLHSEEAIIIYRFAGSSSILILFAMAFFANSVLYGGFVKGKKAKLIVVYVTAEAITILVLYLVVPVSFTTQSFNNIIYQYREFIALAYVPMVLPILYVFINMERADPPNKMKYRLYLAGFITAIVELAMDIPSTMPEFTFLWRLFALAGMVLVIIALLLPKAKA